MAEPAFATAWIRRHYQPTALVATPRPLRPHRVDPARLGRQRVLDRADHGHQRALVAATCVGAGGLVMLAAAPTEARVCVVAAVVTACVGFDIAQMATGTPQSGLIALIAQLAIGWRLIRRLR